MAGTAYVTNVNTNPNAMSLLTDAFTTNDLSTTWTNYYGTVAVANNECSIQADASYDSGIISSVTYSIVSSYVSGEFFPYIAASGETGMQVYDAAANTATIAYYGENMVVTMVQGGVKTTSAPVPYSATAHAWWRIRESSGTLYFDTAPDGLTWTNFWSSTYTMTATALSVKVYAGDYGSDATGTSYVTNINVPPVNCSGSVNVPKPSIAGVVGSGSSANTTSTGSAAVPKPSLSGSATIVNPVSSLGTPAMVRSTSGSVTGSWGTGQTTTAGDLLAAVVSAAAATSVTAIACSTPGWVMQAETGNTATSAHAYIAVWTKKAAGSDTAPVFTTTLSGTGAMTVTLLELPGGNQIAPLDVSGVYGSGASAGTLSAMSAATTQNVGLGQFAVGAFVQEATAATNTWNESGSGFSNVTNDGSTSSVAHTAVNTRPSPATGAGVTDAGNWTADTSAYGAGLVVVFLPVLAPGQPLINIADAFAANDIATLWDNSYGTTTVSGGECTVGTSSSLISTGTYSVYGYSAYGQFGPYTATGTSVLSFQLYSDVANAIEIQYYQGTMTAAITEAGVRTSLSSPVTYNAANHAWWQISESGGTLTFATAPDGMTWTTLWSTTYYLDLSAMYVQVLATGVITRGTASTLAVTGSASSLATTWATNPAAGSKVLVFVTAQTATAPTSVKDNGTSQTTFTLDKSETNAGDGFGVYIYRGDGISLPASGSYAVTAAMGGATVIVTGGVAYAGVAAGAPAASNVGTATSMAVSAGSMTPGTSPALYFGAFIDISGLNPETIALNWAAGAGQFTETNGSSYNASGCADAITAGTQTPAWTLGDSVLWTAAGVSYNVAAASATVTNINALTVTSSGSIAVPKPALSGQVNPGTLGSLSGSITVPKPGFAAQGAVSSPPEVFPLDPLVILAELDIDGTWTDITDYVYQRDAITITRGRPNEASTISPGSMAITLNNRDGRFSPRNPSGPYFGYLGRNTQLRLSAPADPLMDTLAYRFWGEVPAWPPQWDTAGNDVFVQVAVAGVTRRLTQSGVATLGTALTRYFQNLAGAATPAAMWPCDDASTATSLASAISGVNPMTISGAPALSSVSAFDGSAAIPVLNGASFTGTIGAKSAAAKISTVTYTSGSASGTIPAGVTELIVEGWSPGGPGAGATSTIGGFSGGGGGYGRIVIPVAGGTSYSWTVGSTSTGGTANSPGSNGSSTTFTYNGVVVLVVTPGGASGGGHGGSGGGGSGSVGQVLYQGGAGSTAAGAGGAGGGSSAGPSSDGIGGTKGTAAAGAAGGPAVVGGGAGGQGGAGIGTGGNGASPGGGGAGGGVAFGVAGSGGNGGAGWLKMSFNSPSASTLAANVLRFLLEVPAAGDTNSGVLARLLTSGTVSQMDVIYGTGGTLRLIGYSGSVVLFDSAAVSFNVNGQPLVVTAELQQNGTSITWVLGTILAGGNQTELLYSGTVPAASVSGVSTAMVNPGGLLLTTALGALAVQYTVSPAQEMAYAAAGWEGENAATRFQRLCSEEDVPAELTGNNSDTALMGAQTPQTLMALLQECESADLGQLYEPRDMFGLGYRTRVDMVNQTPGCALDYAQQQLSGPLAPTDDDQLIANDVTVTRTGGSSLTLMTTTGPLSVNRPPSGVGPYLKSYTVNLFADEQLPGVAGWLLSIGSVDQQRFPAINVDLSRNTEIGAVFGDIAGLDVGDLLTIANPPAWMPPETIQQLAVGWTEVLNTYTWTIEWNAIPALPYFTGVVGNGAVYGKADTDGSALTAGITRLATTMQVTTTNAGSPLWTTAAGDFPFDVIVNGERITVTSITGTSNPQTFTVIRGINGVALGHNSGESVSLFYPATTGI